MLLEKKSEKQKHPAGFATTKIQKHPAGFATTKIQKHPAGFATTKIQKHPAGFATTKIQKHPAGFATTKIHPEGFVLLENRGVCVTRKGKLKSKAPHRVCNYKDTPRGVCITKES